MPVNIPQTDSNDVFFVGNVGGMEDFKGCLSFEAFTKGRQHTEGSIGRNCDIVLVVFVVNLPMQLH